MEAQLAMEYGPFEGLLLSKHRVKNVDFKCGTSRPTWIFHMHQETKKIEWGQLRTMKHQKSSKNPQQVSAPNTLSFGGQPRHLKWRRSSF